MKDEELKQLSQEIDNKGLSFSTSGLLKVLRYLWSLPVVRTATGGAIQFLIEKVIALLKRKRNKKKLDGNIT